MPEKKYGKERETPASAHSKNGSKGSGTKGKNKGEALPLSAKITIIVLMLFASMLIGMMIGYGILGKSPVGDIFSIETWTHLFALIFG
ncbi:MAG: DNA-directed RNA polymerase subunit beta [Thermicanus sp.]|nr:DNA-directed RNA polymerase subunit beta [Thermicanus sp.]